MTNNIKFIAVGTLVLVVVLGLSACGIARPSTNEPATAAPGHGPDISGGMMGTGMMRGGHMGGGMMSGMMSGGMMGSNDYGQSLPTAEPTPIGATPVPVDEKTYITAFNLRFAPAQVTFKPGETVRFVVTNNDPYLHNFGSQEAGIPFLSLPGNTTQTVTWTAPATEGTYKVLCTLHPGMAMTITIESP